MFRVGLWQGFEKPVGALSCDTSKQASILSLQHLGYVRVLMAHRAPLEQVEITWATGQQAVGRGVVRAVSTEELEFQDASNRYSICNSRHTVTTSTPFLKIL